MKNKINNQNSNLYSQVISTSNGLTGLKTNFFPALNPENSTPASPGSPYQKTSSSASRRLYSYLRMGDVRRCAVLFGKDSYSHSRLRW